MEERRTSDSVDGFAGLAWTANFVVFDWKRAKTFFIYVLFTLFTYYLIHYAQSRHSLVLICRNWVGIGTYFAGRGGDGDRGCGDGVGMGFVFTGTGGDGVQFLSPCRPLVLMSVAYWKVSTKDELRKTMCIWYTTMCNNSNIRNMKWLTKCIIKMKLTVQLYVAGHSSID